MEGKSFLQCEMCEKVIGKDANQMYILGAFHLDRSHELKFCSKECINDFLNLGVFDEFENEDEKEQESEKSDKE